MAKVQLSAPTLTWFESLSEDILYPGIMHCENDEMPNILVHAFRKHFLWQSGTSAQILYRVELFLGSSLRIFSIVKWAHRLKKLILLLNNVSIGLTADPIALFVMESLTARLSIQTSLRCNPLCGLLTAILKRMEATGISSPHLADKIRRETEASNFDPYRLYIERATLDDRNFVKECNESMDTMMVFAGLFSAAITQFIASTYPLLQPDAQGKANDLLVILIMATKDPSTDISHLTNTPDFQPSMPAIAINSLFFFSLILSLLAALGAMLVKQLARRYETHGTGQILPWKKARIREKKRAAFQEWRIEEAIAFIPMLLHIALLLFLMGIIIWTSLLSRSSMIPSILLVSLAGLLYCLLAVAPSISEDAPLQWPASSGIKSVVGAFRCLRRGKVENRSQTGKANPLASRASSPFMPLVNAIRTSFKPTAPNLDVEKGSEAPSLRENSARQNTADILQEPQSDSNPPDSTFDHMSSQAVKQALDVVEPTGKRAHILPAIQTGGITFLQTPSDISQSHKEQIYPPSYEALDIVILINLLRETEVNQELVYIFETLRTANWGTVKVGDVFAMHGEVILHRCSQVSATTWELSGGLPQLREGLRRRARQMCLFIEWFYYQLNVQQRQALRNWPHPGMVEGLVRDDWSTAIVENAPELDLDDLLLGTSVRAKLHHVQLAEGEICDWCITQTERDEYDIRSRLRLRDFYLPDGAVDITKMDLAETMQAKVSACISSDTDCLLHYVRGLPDEELKQRIEASSLLLRSRIQRYISSLSQKVSFSKLRVQMNSLRDVVPEEDPRMLWFTEMCNAISEDAVHKAQLRHRFSTPAKSRLTSS